MASLPKGGNGWKRKRDPFSHFMATLERHPALIPSISLAREMCYCTPLWEWETGEKKKKERLCASEDMGPSTHVCARRQMFVSTLVSLATSEIKPVKFYPLYLIIGPIVLVHRQNAYFSGHLYLLSHTPVRRSGFLAVRGKKWQVTSTDTNGRHYWPFHCPNLHFYNLCILCCL